MQFGYFKRSETRICHLLNEIACNNIADLMIRITKIFLSEMNRTIEFDQAFERMTINKNQTLIFLGCY